MDREQALDTVLGQIERQFGKGAVMKMNDQAQVVIGAVSTGSLSLDVALGVGGLPRGRIVEVFGPESSGKTTLVYHVIAEAQRRGGICAFIDAEHSMDPAYAKRIGVNIDDLLVSQPDTGEQALEICELLVRSGALAVVAIDSVAALTPKAEIEGEMGDSHVGLQARLMSQALRKLAGTLNRTDTICLFTNQLREKIGVMFGNPETTPGGRALRFYASVRLDIRRIETLKDGVEAYGNRVRVKVVKNKVAPPFKQAEFDIIYGDGISWEGTVLETGLEKKVVQKSGSYFSFGDDRLGQGRQNATAFLKEHPDIVQGILLAVQAQAPEGQVISARLLPEGDQPVEARPVLEEVEGGRRGSDRGGVVSREPRERDPVELAARALQHRDRSRRELDERLARAGVGDSERADALDTLERVGYVDDARFAALACRLPRREGIRRRGDPARSRGPRGRRRGRSGRDRRPRAGGRPGAGARGAARAIGENGAAAGAKGLLRGVARGGAGSRRCGGCRLSCRVHGSNSKRFLPAQSTFPPITHVS